MFTEGDTNDLTITIPPNDNSNNNHNNSTGAAPRPDNVQEEPHVPAASPLTRFCNNYESVLQMRKKTNRNYNKFPAVKISTTGHPTTNYSNNVSLFSLAASRQGSSDITEGENPNTPLASSQRHYHQQQPQQSEVNETLFVSSSSIYHLQKQNSSSDGNKDFSSSMIADGHRRTSSTAGGSQYMLPPKQEGHPHGGYMAPKEYISDERLATIKLLLVSLLIFFVFYFIL